MRPHPASNPKPAPAPVKAPTPRANTRRLRYLLQTAVLLLAITAVCLFAVLLASRNPLRIDVTATREHALSPRTLTILDGLKAPHEILVTTNAATIDPSALERTTDVLAAFRRASTNVRVSMIDVGGGAGDNADRGQAELDAALARLTDRYRAELTAGTTGIAQAAAAVRALTPEIANLGTQLQSAHDAIPESDNNAAAIKRFLTDSATVARVSAADLLTAADRAEELAKGTIPHTPVPPIDHALRTLRAPLGAYLQQLEQIGEGTLAIANSTAKGVPPQAKAQTAPLAPLLQKQRDRIARLVLDLDQLPRTPLPEATRVLMSTSAALVIAPPAPLASPSAGAPTQPRNSGSLRGITALDIQSLLPLRIGMGDPALDGIVTPRPDLRFRAEELFAGALASLSTPNAPIVCLIHGAPESDRLGPEFKPLASLVQRLSLRGIDLIEWPAATQPEPPTAALTAIDPARLRPVVYVVIPTNALAGEAGALRSKKLADAVARLVQNGSAVLYSFNPSNLPSIGQKDPMAEPLAALGIAVDSGHPLLMRLPNPNAPTGAADASIVTPDLFVTRTDADHPVAAAAQSLRTYLSWALPMVIDPAAQSASGTTISPLITIPADPKIWGESEWLGFRQTPAAQRAMLINPPMPDSARDDQQGPWIVALAAERARPGTGTGASTPQRIIAVGANGWFFDEYSQIASGTDVTGRPILRNPGNLEFFDACISWLAHQENLIARSAEAQSVATIPDLSNSTLITLRWVLILGMPALVLGLGLLWRMLRG